jgi:membrane peptidoglycan carboxypeptidase
MPQQQESGSRPRRVLRHGVILLLCLALLAAAAWLALDELEDSRWQAHFLSRIGAQLNFKLEPGPGEPLHAPTGPYDERLGYSQMPAFSARLAERGFAVTGQARPSPRMVRLADLGVFPPYREKDRAGLRLTDCGGTALHETAYPERIYERFEAVPPLMVDSLLFIENRELLDATNPTRNPAVEWDRFAKAALDQALSLLQQDHGTPGGSTLATQIEKYRHSPEGRTGSRVEKLRQMASASLRAYLDGEDTMAARRSIVLAYLNTVPLSAKPGFGEVNGMGDGLWAWYGRDFGEINRLLASSRTEELPARALAYKQALSLTIAQRRPTYYLTGDARVLNALVDQYLRLLAEAGVIQPALRDAALAATLAFRTDPAVSPPASFIGRKATNALRTHLASMLGVPRFYDLDRLDLTATSTLNGTAQRAVTTVLRELKNPERARAVGLDGFRMLGSGDDPGKVIYSFTLFERAEGANLLRVQTDNYDQPFDINEGAKLDLGSTAKLRTLITYLEIFADLHTRYAALQPDELRALPPGDDALTRWTIDYLIHTADRSLRTLLEAAMDRQYSASPAETFFTGGGAHTFANFKREDDHQILPVREALRHSVNLVFIRIMRDVVRHYMYRNPAADPALLEDADDPRRHYYLARFADREGRTFIGGFYRKYRGKSAVEAEDALLGSSSPRRLAVALRSIAPELDLAAFSAAMRRHLGSGNSIDDATLKSLFERYGPDKYDLPDRGYLAGVHPLELWLVGFLRAHPGATLAQVTEASQDERLAVYTWLYRTRHKNAQDVRIRSLLEVEAFIEIGRAWRRLGYPFDTLTPSYASSIGSSGDRPAALAELMGIIVNKGLRLPAARFSRLHFADRTPYEARYARQPAAGERVLPEELTEVVRNAVIDVVDNGTARRLKGAFVRPDGSAIEAGGKTGTGDHRREVYGRGGQLVSATVISRSATLVFLIGERFFGTITAYVAEPYAERYVFTSALAVQLLKALAPSLMPLIDGAGGSEGACPAPG